MVAAAQPLYRSAEQTQYYRLSAIRDSRNFLFGLSAYAANGVPAKPCGRSFASCSSTPALFRSTQLASRVMYHQPLLLQCNPLEGGKKNTNCNFLPTKIWFIQEHRCLNNYYSSPTKHINSRLSRYRLKNGKTLQRKNKKKNAVGLQHHCF